MNNQFETTSVLSLSLRFNQKYIVLATLALCLALALLITTFALVYPAAFHPAHTHHAWSLVNGPNPNGSEPWE